MSIIYFDICAIPLFLMILFVCFSRKMTQGSTNRLFNGQIILEQTIHMMQRIGKRLVVEGAETAKAVEMLRTMDCDYI